MSRYFPVLFYPLTSCSKSKVAQLRMLACSFEIRYTSLQCLDNDGTKGTVTNDLRRRIEERALEKEEEDYFNEDRYNFFFLNDT